VVFLARISRITRISQFGVRAERVAFCLDLAIIFPYTFFAVGEERGA